MRQEIETDQVSKLLGNQSFHPESHEKYWRNFTKKCSKSVLAFRKVALSVVSEVCGNRQGNLLEVYIR